MTELRIAEFNYELLHGILNNNVSVSIGIKMYHLCVKFVKQRKTQDIFCMNVKLLNLFGRK